jgi:hypothetical protein
MGRGPYPLTEMARQVGRRPLYRPPPRNSRMATASMVCGIVGFFTCGLTSPAGLILGVMALLFIRDSDGELDGRGSAIAGVILSSITLVVFFAPLFWILAVRGSPLRWLGL